MGGGDYDGLICGIFSQSKVRYIKSGKLQPLHFFLVAWRLPRLINVHFHVSMSSKDGGFLIIQSEGASLYIFFTGCCVIVR